MKIVLSSHVLFDSHFGYQKHKPMCSRRRLKTIERLLLTRLLANEKVRDVLGEFGIFRETVRLILVDILDLIDLVSRWSGFTLQIWILHSRNTSELMIKAVSVCKFELHASAH